MMTERRDEQLRIQALGAALSRRDWQAAEQAYNAIRDHFDACSSTHAVVPLEPTTAMLAAGQRAWLDDPQKLSSTLFKAMVHAAAQVSDTPPDWKQDQAIQSAQYSAHGIVYSVGGDGTFDESDDEPPALDETAAAPAACIEPDELAELIADRSANRAADAILKEFIVTRRRAACAHYHTPNATTVAAIEEAPAIPPDWKQDQDETSRLPRKPLSDCQRPEGEQ